MNVENLLSKYYLCYDKHDPFIQDKPIWVAGLDCGKNIYQDDGRKGCGDYSAWIRLGKLIKNENINIVNLKLMFGTHVVNVIDDCDAYYFSMGAQGQMGSSTQHFYVVGGIRNIEQEKFTCKWYIIPALEIIRIDKKENDPQKLGQRLITNATKEEKISSI